MERCKLCTYEEGIAVVISLIDTDIYVYIYVRKEAVCSRYVYIYICIDGGRDA